MNRKLMELAEKYVTQRKRRMRLFKTVTALALVVAICTSYVLMMPGLTMAAETYCGLEEHTHTADCYVDELTCLIPEREATTVFTDIMRCSFEPHHHSSDCYNALGELSCGYWGGYIHEHDEKCYDDSGVLICTLEEHPMHKHTDACYNWEKQLTCTLAESEGHIHTDACYRAKEPTCGLFENDGHQHTADCVTETRTLICTKDVATDSDMPHVHDDSCYEVTRTYTCGLAEGEGAHHHTDACYPTTEEPTCGLLEGEGAHTHDDSCYEMVRGDLKCKLYPDPAKVHTHSASCVDAKTGYYTCGYIQVLRHQHTNECIVTVTAEDSGHHHTADCYERHYICGKEEHTHTADCYYDPTPNPDATEAPVDEPTVTPAATDEPEATAEPTEAPTATPAPTDEPEATVEPTEKPTATVEPADEPEATVEPTEEPTATPTPTDEPEVTVEPTEEPMPTVEPTDEPEATAEPTEEPTATVEPTDEPSPTPAITVIPPMDDIIAIQPAENMDQAFVVTAADDDDNMDSLVIKSVSASNFVKGDNTYQYDFSAKISIDTDRIGKHDKNNPIKIPADKFHYRVTDADNQPMNGTDASYSGTDPAFKFRYNPQDDTIEMWFTDDYIAWTAEKIKNESDYKTANGSMTMNAEIRKDDIKDLDDKDLSIGFGGASTTIKSEDVNPGNSSILSDLSTSKKGGEIDWKTGTIKYYVDINTSKGTNGESVSLKDIMSATNQNITLTGMNVTNVNKNWATAVPAIESDLTTVVTDGSACGCGTTGNHIHYKHQMDTSGNAHTATTDYILPPLEAGECYRVEYVYTFDKANWNGEFDKMTNRLTAESGSKWDHTDSSSNKDIDVKTDKLQKSGYDSKDGYVTWKVTVNSNYFNIKDKSLTDTMLGAVIDADGKLLFAAADGSGYVKEIKATNTKGETIVINSDNYEDYFTVTKGEDGKASLTFKDTDCRFQITYKTPVESSSTTQVISNDAEFDEDTEHRDVSVRPDERYTVAKTVSADMPSDPSKGSEYTDGLYPVTWNTTYQFAATENVRYKLSFGDEIEPDGWRGNRPRHYMTSDQAQKLLTSLLASDIAAAHGAQKIPFRIVMYTYDESFNTRTEQEVCSFDGTTMINSLTTGKHYYGFKFETVGEEGVILNTDDEDTTQLTYNLSYASTVYLEENRAGQIELHNRATNAAKTSDAYYKIYPNDLVDKKYGNRGVGDLTGDNKITIHEDELYWTIELRSDGDAHDEITLVDTLPPHILVDSIEYGNSKLARSETDDTKLTVASKKTDNAGTIPEGYEVSSDYNQARISIKADLAMVGEGANQQQKITISMKPNENQGNPTILDGPHNLTIRIRCKIDPALMADKTNPLWQNGQLNLGELDNHLEVKYGTDGSLITKDQVTDLTYEEETVDPKNVQKGYKVTPGNYNAKITYTVDINQSGAELNPQSSTLQLNDTMTYEALGLTGWPEWYPYLRDVELDESSVKLYYALKDENSVPILEVDEAGKGHLVCGSEVPKYLWKLDFEETESGTSNYRYPADTNVNAAFTGSTAQKRQLKMTITVPDGEALILEYTVREDISMPPEANGEYNLGQVRDKGITPALSNTVNLTGVSGRDTISVDNNNDYFSRGEGYINYGLVIRKVDSVNNSLLLPGTEFTLYSWDETQEKFVPVEGNGGKIYTNSNGQLTFDYDQSKLNERPLNPNTAYLLVETKAVTPYNLVLEDRPIIVFHVPANPGDDEKNPPHYPGDYDKTTFGSLSAADLAQYIPASEIPGVINGVYTVNGSATINIQMKNSKDRRDLYVTKSWHDESETTRPDSVHVMLRRYALTQEQYDEMLAMGAEETPNKTVTMTVESSGETLTKSETYPAGTTIEIILNTSWFRWNRDNRLKINGEIWECGSDRQFHKTITLEKDGTYDLNVTYEEYYDRWVEDPDTKEWKHETGWETRKPNIQGWTIAITHEPTGIFTPAQWDYIKQYPDTSYEGRDGTLTAANGWTTGWQQLESTGATDDGHKLYYIYYIVEGKVPYYTTSGITYTIDPTASKTTGTVTAELLNTHRPENLYGEINFDVSKEWYAADGTKHTITEGFAGVQVALYKTRWDYNTATNTWTKANTERIYTTTLAEANRWSFKTNALETYTVEKQNGAVMGAYAYTYSMAELNTPSGYDSLMQVSGVPQDPWEYFSDNNISSPKEAYQIGTTIRGTLTLKNVEVENLRIDVVKHWEMADYIHVADTDTLTFRLTREIQQDGEWAADSTFTPVTKTLTITDLADKRIGLGEYPKYTVTGFSENGEPIKAYYRYKVEETQYNGGDIPFRVSYDPADSYVLAETATVHETVTVTNKPSEIGGLYRFNVTKQWYNANMSLAENASGVAVITVKRIKHIYDPATAVWTADADGASMQVIRLTGSETYMHLWEQWNDDEMVHVEYNADGTVKSAWAYTYEVAEAAIDGYFGTQHLPAGFPQQPGDYFTDETLTALKDIYHQPLTDTLPEVVEKNYDIEYVNVKVDKTWARFIDRDELTFCLIQMPVVGYDADGKEIVDVQQTRYFYVTQSLTGEAAPEWVFTNLPKYYFTVNEAGEAVKMPYQYSIAEAWDKYGNYRGYGYQVIFSGDVQETTNGSEWGKVELPADGETAEIHAKNLPLRELGFLNLTVEKLWRTSGEKPESITLTLTPIAYEWKNDTKEWVSRRLEHKKVQLVLKEENGQWKTNARLEMFYVIYKADGTIDLDEFAYMAAYELDEVLVDGTASSIELAADWPKEPGDVFELDESGAPTAVKERFRFDPTPQEGTADGELLYTITDTSATVTNVQTGKINIEKKWAEEPEFNGAQNPLGIERVSISLFRNVWAENWTDSDGVIHYDWSYDSFQQNYILTAENGWKLTIDNLPLYDTTLNPDGSLRKYRYYIIENTSVGNDTLDRYIPVMTADEGEIIGSILYITFKDTTENNVTITNVPKSISIVKQWADADTFGEAGMMQDIYLEVMMKYPEPYSTRWKTENLLEKSYFSLKNVICKPSSLTAELVQINGTPYLHVSGLAKADEPWCVTIRNLPGYDSASFIIREVELAGYLNNLPDGKLELGFNEIGTITNTPTKLTITKKFTQAYDYIPDEKPLYVRNTDVYLQIWRGKLDEYNILVNKERYTPALGTLEANMDATVLPDGTIKLTVGTETAASSATVTLNRLPRYWVDTTTGERGEWYYYVVEVDADGNEVHAAYESPTNGAQPDITQIPNITITNTLTDIDVRKVWVSLDNQVTLNPANLPDITLTLMQTIHETPQVDDVKFATVTLGWDAEAGKVTVKSATWAHGAIKDFAANPESKNIWWGYTWKNLPAYDTEGNLYRYYVVEQTPVGSGWQLVTDDPNATNTLPISADSENRTFQITNSPITYVLPETGGIGTLPYTAGGLLLMAAAALLLGQEIKRRREGC